MLLAILARLALSAGIDPAEHPHGPPAQMRGRHAGDKLAEDLRHCGRLLKLNRRIADSGFVTCISSD